MNELCLSPAYAPPQIGWVDTVPNTWSMVRVKGIVANVVDLTKNADRDDVYLALEHVESWTGEFTVASEGFAFDSQVKRFRSRDVLFGKLRPYLAKVVCPGRGGVCSGEFLVLRPSIAGLSPEYLEQLLRSKPLVDAIDASTFGAKMPRADWQFIGNMKLPLPPVAEQRAIVRFLDHADLCIRRYVRARERLIELLEEQRRVLIQEAVTGRFDVRTEQPYPAYKDSGVEWLGQVPEHWGIRRSKRIFVPRKELARPDDIQLSATQAYGVIAQKDYEERVGRKIVKIFKHLNRRRHVEVDDFVISMRSFQGGLERARVSGCIRSSYIVLMPATSLNVTYFAYLFKSASYIRALQSTTNFIRDGQDLNFSDFCKVDLPFPPIETQRRIAKFLDSATNDVATTCDRYRRQIDLLHEYRTRLIADVVTGKLDVRGAAAKLPETDPLAGGRDRADAIYTVSNVHSTESHMTKEAIP